MEVVAETSRLILRQLVAADAEAFFVMDSNSEVHKYLGNSPMQTISQAQHAIQLIQQQYADNNIGRWATIEKATGEFIGWSGLKLVKEIWNNQTDYMDVGYRFHPAYWGKGYATESAIAALAYGFEQLNCTEIIGTANVDNKASIHVLEKCGLQLETEFVWNNLRCNWMSISKGQWDSQLQNKNML